MLHEIVKNDKEFQSPRLNFIAVSFYANETMSSLSSKILLLHSPRLYNIERSLLLIHKHERDQYQNNSETAPIYFIIPSTILLFDTVV